MPFIEWQCGRWLDTETNRPLHSTESEEVLAGLGLSELSKRASAAGVPSPEIDAALDCLRPNTALMELVLNAANLQMAEAGQRAAQLAGSSNRASRSAMSFSSQTTIEARIAGLFDQLEKALPAAGNVKVIGKGDSITCAPEIFNDAKSSVASTALVPAANPFDQMEHLLDNSDAECSQDKGEVRACDDRIRSSSDRAIPASQGAHMSSKSAKKISGQRKKKKSVPVGLTEKARSRWRNKHGTILQVLRRNLRVASYRGVGAGGLRGARAPGVDGKTFFQFIDRNRSGKLEFAEFRSAVRRLCKNMLTKVS
eukprot:SAG31_NODE_729_length_12511_cov_7.059293_9_plen_311_part_00